MYKVIVVDDESEIREGIIRKIPWQELGYTVVGDAENGVDALELVEMTQPDVVISDIRIPFMDGLTLASRIHEVNLSTQVIIISGFDDFDYARRAVSLNVVEYLMKPINAEELSETLRKLKDKLDRERGQQRDMKSLKDLFDTHLPVLREQFLQELLSGQTDEANLRQRSESLKMGIVADETHPVAVAYIGESAKAEDESDKPARTDRALLPFFVKQSVDEMLNKNHRITSFVRSEGVVLFVTMLEEGDVVRLVRDLNTLCQFVRSVMWQGICAGVGNTVTSLSALGQSFQEASTAYLHSAFVGNQQALFIGDIEPQQTKEFPFTKHDWQDLSLAITMQSGEQLDGLLDRLFLKLSGYSWNKRMIQELGLEILTGLLQLMRSYELDEEIVFGADSNLIEEVAACRLLTDLERWTRKTCTKTAEEVRSLRKSSADRLANEAKNYVLNHFSDPGLSVETICSVLHVSPAYFSTTFKKQTGQSFVSFLTEVRMNEAKRLLETTDEKTYIITSKVGYTEANYFSYAFKKQFGISPTRYRRQSVSEAGSSE